MKKIIASIVAMTLVMAVHAQKTINDANAEKRNVSGFHAVEVSGGVDLYLTQGDESVAVSATEAIYKERLKTVVENGVLKIWYDYEKGWGLTRNSGKMKLKAYVSAKNLDRLIASGGSDVDIDGTLKASKLELKISGGSDFDGRVDIGDFIVRASGGSDVKISGGAKSLDLDASGGSDFKGFDLAVENCTVDANGGSDVSITANGQLDAKSSGGSDVHYKGNAVIKESKSSGGGSVKKVK